MENWIYAAWPVVWKMVLSCLIIFVAMIGVTRFFGLRTFAKMSSFDFASTIAIGSILAAVVMNGQQSLTKGALAIAVIVLLQSVFSYLSRKSGIFRSVAQNTPILLMQDGEIHHHQLTKANMSVQDLMAKLREAEFDV
ncbi:hypothetical protein NT6N_05100 [Oceaniferula spumae]|uniref:YetF C-terminal domain-containing protein n=1 Tax=Oceaniferula spumae TaxID=2979115 RepID=A0AAT9FHN8_9BACT